MLLIDIIRRKLIRIGYLRKGGGRNYLPVTLLIISAFLIVNILFYVNHNLNAIIDEDTRKLNILLALKEIDLVISEIGLILQFSSSKKHIDSLLIILDSRYSCYNDYLPEDHKELIRLTKKKQKDTVQYMGFIGWSEYSLLNVLPGAVAVVVILNKGLFNTEFTYLPLPMAIYIPKNFNNIIGYISAYVLSSLYLFFCYSHGILALTFISATPQKVTADMKLFSMELATINKVLEGTSDCLKLRDYTNYLVRRHQEIQNDVKVLTRCVSGIMCVFNQTMCCHLCVFLFCATEVNIKVIQILAFFCVFLTLMALVLYCHNGQQLINEGEELRRNLYGCEWIDKPMWFKKDLLQMKIMANVPLQIKPLGLYVVNYQSVVTISNAAYSYFNIIRTLNK